MTDERSTETPRGSPVAGSFAARIGLPKLIAARSVPVGARSERAAAGTCGVVAHDASNASASAPIAVRIIE